MALSVDTPMKITLGEFNSLPAAATAQPYEGSMCSIDGDGYVDALTAGAPFVGHAWEECDNSAGAAAAKNVKLRTGRYRAEVSVTGASLLAHGMPVYASDDATLTTDPGTDTAPNSLVGVMVRYVSSGIAVVEFRAGEAAAPLVSDDIVFEDDFLGDSLGAHWATVDVGDATQTIVADEHGGAVSCLIAATSEAEDAVIYFGDELNFDIDHLKRIEMRAKIITPGAGVTLVWGMAGAHDLDKDTVAQNAWFRVEGGTLDLLVESDDGTNNNDDDDTAINLVSDAYHDFMIDFTDTSDVKFFVDGVQVSDATTFDMSNYTGGLQPYFSGDKASGTTTGQVIVDKVKITAARG